MRCREHAAFGEALTSRTRPGTAVVPSGWSAGNCWPGPARPGPGAARPAKRERSIARESTTVRLFPYTCGTRGGCAGHGTARTVASMALRCRATSSRGPQAVGVLGAARRGLGRIRGRVVDGAGGYYSSSSFTQGEWSEGGGTRRVRTDSFTPRRRLGRLRRAPSAGGPACSGSASSSTTTSRGRARH